MEFPLLLELREEGATDLLVTPLVFTDGDVHAALWATRQPGGYTDEQIAGIEAIVDPFARVAEVRALRRTATNLLDTYVGSRTGQRILAGEIRRGHVGEVLYGNIGGGNRLDFTCIGPAVNLAARLEKIAAKLERIIVTSEAFASHCQFQLSSLGQFTRRGFGPPQTVFCLPDEG